MTAGKIPAVAVLGSIVALVLIVVSAVVGLEVAGRPVGTVLQLSALVAAPTIVTLLGLIKAADTNHVVRNGLATDVAQKVAENAAELVTAQAAAAAETGGRRAGDPAPPG